MEHRERFHRAVNHQKTDRAVFDLSGNPQTRVDYQQTKDALAAELGLEGPAVYLTSNHFLDERSLTALDIDTRSVGGMPTPDTSHVREEGGVAYDAFGIGYRMMDGRAEICYSPLRDCTMSEFEAYEFPDPAKISQQQLDQWAKDAEWLHTQTDYAVIAEHSVLGVFELGSRFGLLPTANCPGLRSCDRYIQNRRKSACLRQRRQCGRRGPHCGRADEGVYEKTAAGADRA